MRRTARHKPTIATTTPPALAPIALSKPDDNGDPALIRRARVAELVARHGVQPIAKKLGISRSALGAYLIGQSHKGTIALVELMLERLYPSTPTEKAG